MTQTDSKDTVFQRWRLNSQVNYRKARIAVAEALKPNQVLSITSAVVTVFSIGVGEAWLLTANTPRPKGAWRFCLRYGALQILPSIIWVTKPADVIVRSMGKDPSKYLRKFDLHNLQDSKASLRVTTLQNLR